jgi:signal transduction histidine kinase
MLNEQLRRVSGSLITSQDQERRRIARELHDSLGQELSVAKMVADGIPHRPAESKDEAASEVSALIDRALQQVRSISHLLHPPLLDEAGLCSALKLYVQGFTKRCGIDASIEVQPANFPRLAPDLETTIFRIVQEALTNVFRHSEARKATVSLLAVNGEISLKVLDDGKGMADYSMKPRSTSVGVGLGGMRQRAKQFGGELRLRAGNPGTLVEVIVPTRLSAPLPAHAVHAKTA